MAPTIRPVAKRPILVPSEQAVVSAQKKYESQLPRAGDKTGLIRKKIESGKYTWFENMWAKNPRTGNLMTIPHKKTGGRWGRPGIYVKPKVLKEYSSKYSMLVHPHPPREKKELTAGPSLGDANVFLRSNSRSSAIAIINQKGEVAGTVMLIKTKEARIADEKKRKQLAKALEKEIKHLIKFDLYSSLLNREYKTQVALNMLINAGNTKQFGFRAKVFPSEGYKVIEGPNHKKILERRTQPATL